MRAVLAAIIFTLTFLGTAQADILDTVRKQTVEVLTEKGLGTGIVIDNDTVLTAHHVVDEEKNVKVLLAEGDDWPAMAKVIRNAPELDLAVLRLKEPSHIPPVVINCDVLRWGEPVFIVGFPLGLPWVLTHGYIASMHPIEGSDYVLVDVQTNHGNSGGPVFNTKGELVGILLAGFDTGDKDRTTPFTLGLIRPTSTFCNSKLLKGN
jgi:S1-C subfamily serine protease